MKDIADQMINEMIEAGYTRRAAIKEHRERMNDDPDYRDFIYSERNI